MSSQLQTQKKPVAHASASPIQQLQRSRVTMNDTGDRALDTESPNLETHHATAQNLGTQLTQAKRFGHHLGHVPSHAQSAPVQSKAIQRDAAQEEEEAQASGQAKLMTSGSDPVQRQAMSFGTTGSGESMPKTVRAKMEQSFGSSFGDVKIHQNSMQAKAVGALAYTQGNQIHFAPGQYNPKSLSGQALLGHELTHVVQQRAGRVPVPAQSKGAPINADPSLEHEADVMGARAARGQLANVPGAPTAQRKVEPIQQKGQQHEQSEQAEQPVQNSQQPVQFFLAMLLPMLMPMIQQMLPQILQSVMGAGGGGGGSAGGGAA